MIEPDRQKILQIVDCLKMRFPVKIKVLRELHKQAHLRMRNVPRWGKT